MKNCILLFSFLIFFTSCGADPIKKASMTNSLANVSGNNQCSCNSVYMPVCDSNKNNFDNQCLAECMGKAPTKPGHCECSSTLMVCGVVLVSSLACLLLDFSVSSIISFLLKVKLF
jgi:hypothetical protein